jgi:hypothetical protein
MFFEPAGILRALACLPSLEKVTLGLFEYDDGEEAAEGLTNLLKSPSLRSIEFSEFILFNSLNRALSAAFEQGSFVTNLRYTDCQFEDDGDANEVIRALV